MPNYTIQSMLTTDTPRDWPSTYELQIRRGYTLEHYSTCWTGVAVMHSAVWTIKKALP